MGVLKAVIAGRPTMKVNTALGVVLLGAALLLRVRNAQRASRWCAALLTALALAHLWEHLTGVDLAIDQLFVTEALTDGAGRMALITSVAFTALGLSLWIDGTASRRAAIAGDACAAFAGLLALGGFAGHLYGFYPLRSLGPVVATIALHTSIALLFAAAAVIAVDRGSPLVRLVLSERAGGRLLDELLELSRVGRSRNPPVHTSFREIAEGALRLTAGGVSRAGARVDLAEVDVPLYGDRTRLTEIWQNLIDNAAKFMGDQSRPHIQVGLREAVPEPVFFVRDNGIGIDPRHSERIFGLFDKLDGTTDGTGVGLALVRRIVELHGGRITVESAGLGHGSCFVFTLPDARRPAPRARSRLPTARRPCSWSRTIRRMPRSCGATSPPLTCPTAWST